MYSFFSCLLVLFCFFFFRVSFDENQVKTFVYEKEVVNEPTERFFLKQPFTALVLPFFPAVFFSLVLFFSYWWWIFCHDHWLLRTELLPWLLIDKLIYLPKFASENAMHTQKIKNLKITVLIYPLSAVIIQYIVFVNFLLLFFSLHKWFLYLLHLFLMSLCLFFYFICFSGRITQMLFFGY